MRLTQVVTGPFSVMHDAHVDLVVFNMSTCY